MTFRLAWVILAVTLVGCGDSDCSKQMRSLSNEGRTRTAELEVSGLCGGATVGYTTHLKLTRHPGNAYGDNGYVWSSRGSIDARIEWAGPTTLKVFYPQTLREEDIFLKTTKWYDVEISYISASGQTEQSLN